MVNGKRDSVNSTPAHKEIGADSCRIRSQPEASPTSMRAINPPSNNAARIHTATCGRLRISPRGGCVGSAKSSESSPVSSTGWRTRRSAAGAAVGARGSSLNSGGTMTMLAPKKSARQGKECERGVAESSSRERSKTQQGRSLLSRTSRMTR
jgi:hypothetical protein